MRVWGQYRKKLSQVGKVYICDIDKFDVQSILNIDLTIPITSKFFLENFPDNIRRQNAVKYRRACGLSNELSKYSFVKIDVPYTVKFGKIAPGYRLYFDESTDVLIVIEAYHSIVPTPR